VEWSPLEWGHGLTDTSREFAGLPHVAQSRRLWLCQAQRAAGGFRSNRRTVPRVRADRRRCQRNARSFVKAVLRSSQASDDLAHLVDGRCGFCLEHSLPLYARLREEEEEWVPCGTDWPSSNVATLRRSSYDISLFAMMMSIPNGAAVRSEAASRVKADRRLPMDLLGLPLKQIVSSRRCCGPTQSAVFVQRLPAVRVATGYQSSQCRDGRLFRHRDPRAGSLMSLAVNSRRRLAILFLLLTSVSRGRLSRARDTAMSTTMIAPRERPSNAARSLFPPFFSIVG